MLPAFGVVRRVAPLCDGYRAAMASASSDTSQGATMATDSDDRAGGATRDRAGDGAADGSARIVAEALGSMGVSGG
jgi:hypothetical protein